MKRILAILLALCLLLSVSAFAADTSDEISDRELENRALARSIAAEGMVLLQNDNNALPLKGDKIALYGAGAYHTIKGGTGSGDVHQREVVNVWDGLLNAGYELTSSDWLQRSAQDYEDELAEYKANGGNTDLYAFMADDIPVTDDDIAAASEADTAIYVLPRTSGENKDRTLDPGDYYLTDTETENIAKIAASFENVVIVLNVGSVIDTDFLREIDGIDSVVLMSQAGMEGGNALADILSGAVTPSGKLTDTWAMDYEDYPSADTYSNNDEDTSVEYYDEDIYVGYRWFDTFGIDPAYEFGYGLSYTDFSMETLDVTADEQTVTLSVKVTNTGDTYSGKEVVQVYYSAPQGRLGKAYQELACYGKTDELAPGQSQILTLSFATADMASFDEAAGAYVLEAGDYILRVGNSSRNTTPAAVLALDKDAQTELVYNLYELSDELGASLEPAVSALSDEARPDGVPVIELEAANIETVENYSEYYGGATTTYTTDASYEPTMDYETVEVVRDVSGATLYDVYTGDVTIEEFVAQMSAEEMATLCCGMGRGSKTGSYVGFASKTVEGAAGESTSDLIDTYGIPNLVMADGPAGIRITQSYTGDDGQTYYQYCTAWPVGTLIAQTWDTDLAYAFGDGVGTEMIEYDVDMWLAPGMNIHRNPLCGRNFEYYAEDPVVAGTIAAAATEGVQSHPGVGVTLKHYIANNQEASRTTVDTVLSERAIREIYLKGFEIAVKQAHPMALMTAFNLLNGIPCSENYDLCMNTARGEWGFEGIIMTDWDGGQSWPVNSMHAGNDMIMPGGSDNAQEIVYGLTLEEPTFSSDGTIALKTFTGMGRVGSFEQWGDFIPVDADGDGEWDVNPDYISTQAESSGSGEPNLTVDENGNYPLAGELVLQPEICLGDLQKCTIDILEVILNSLRMSEVYDNVELTSYSDLFTATEYMTVTKDAVN